MLSSECLCVPETPQLKHNSTVLVLSGGASRRGLVTRLLPHVWD